MRQSIARKGKKKHKLERLVNIMADQEKDGDIIASRNSGHSIGASHFPMHHVMHSRTQYSSHWVQWWGRNTVGENRPSIPSSYSGECTSNRTIVYDQIG